MSHKSQPPLSAHTRAISAGSATLCVCTRKLINCPFISLFFTVAARSGTLRQGGDFSVKFLHISAFFLPLLFSLFIAPWLATFTLQATRQSKAKLQGTLLFDHRLANSFIAFIISHFSSLPLRYSRGLRLH
jgi:hypothetical protein